MANFQKENRLMQSRRRYSSYCVITFPKLFSTLSNSNSEMMMEREIKMQPWQNQFDICLVIKLISKVNNDVNSNKCNSKVEYFWITNWSTFLFSCTKIDCNFVWKKYSTNKICTEIASNKRFMSQNSSFYFNFKYIKPSLDT